MKQRFFLIYFIVWNFFLSFYSFKSWADGNNHDLFNEASTYLDFLGFDDIASLNSTSFSKDILAQSSGYCLGGTLGHSNHGLHRFIDNCLFIGETQFISKKESDGPLKETVKTYGLKLAPGMGFYIFDHKIELGLKLPILFTDQENPPKVSNQSIKPSKGPKFIGSGYFRWDIQEAFIQMELGKELSLETTYWSLGAGHRF